MRRWVSVALLATASTSALADLGASVTLVTGDPTSIYPGQTTRLLITLSNSDVDNALINVGFANSLPLIASPAGHLQVAGVPTYTCTDPAPGGVATVTGTLTAAVGTRDISLAGATIPAASGGTSGTCVIELPVTAVTTTGAAATYSYSIASGAVTGNTAIAPGVILANSGAVQQSIPVSQLDRPTITKSALNSPALTLGGAARVLTVTLTNDNPVPITGFSITDVFPTAGTPAAPIIVLADPALGPSTCTSGAAPTVTGTAGAGSFSATGTIPANGSCTLRVNVVASHTNGTDVYSQNNTINGTTQFSNDLGITAANVSQPVSVRTPLRVTKTVNNTSLADGETGTFTITLTNEGTSALNNVSFTDNPIDGVGNAAYGLKLIAGNPPTSTCGGTLSTIGSTGVSLANGSIPASSSCVVTIPYVATVEQANTLRTYTNTLARGAVVVAGQPGIVSEPDSQAVTVYQSLHISKNASPAVVAPGNPVRYRVTVQNWGAADISSVRISDTFTNGQTFLTGTVNGQNFTPTVTPAACVGVSTSSALGDTSAQLVINTVPGRTNANTPGSCTVEFWAMVPLGATGNIGNVLAANSVCYTSGGGEICNTNSAGSTNSGAIGAVLSVAKSFTRVDGSAVPAGGLPEGTVSRVALTFTNRSSQPLTGLTLGDNLPLVGTSQMRLANPTNIATTCGGTPTFDATPGATSVSMNDATVPARADNGTGTEGSCRLVFDVVAGAGTYPNTGVSGATAQRADGVTQALLPVNSNTATIVYNSVISANKSFAPTSITSGGRSTVTIRLVNSGSVALSDVTVNDPLPTGMLLADPPSAYTTCAGSTTITAAAGTGSAVLAGASVAGNSSCEFIFDVVATGSASWVNTIPAGNITAAGGITNQSAVSDTLAYNAPSGLVVTKISSPSTLTFPGQTSRLTITITAGTQSVTGLAITDYFTVDGTAGAAPNGMAIAPTPAVETSCLGGVPTAVPGGTQVSLSIATLASGSSCTLSVNVTSTAVGGITNHIPVGAITTYQGFSNAGPASTSLTTQSNLGVSKQFTPNVVKPGERSRLRITFYNPTAQPLSNIAVTDNLPTNVTVPAGPNPATSCTGGVVTSTATSVSVSGATLPAASGGVLTSCWAEIDVVVAAQGDYVNTIPVGAVTASSGGNTITNSQPTSDTLRAKLPVVIAKAIESLTLDAAPVAPFTAGTATRAPGQTGVLSIRLTNPNSVALTAVGFTDSLPAGLVVAPTPAVANSCSGAVTADPSGTQVRLAGGTLAANASCVVSVNVLSNISGTYANTIAAGNVSTFEGVTNEEPTRASVIVSVPPGVTKQFEPAVIPPNGTSRLTIFVSNENASALTLTAALTDTLPTVPGQVRVATPPNVISSCVGTVTAAANATSVVLASGSTVPAGGCSIAVDVTAATAGTHNNTIPAGALQTNLGVNPQPANAPLVVSTLGYVSGRVFQENKAVATGVYDAATDAPLAGVSIELRAGASCAAPLATGVTNPVLTDALGNYLFSGLPAGTYSVCEPTQPSGTSNGITLAGAVTAGGTAGTATNVATVPSAINGIVLVDGGGGNVSGSTGNNFAEIVLSSISGTAFIDVNNNGVQNGADTPLAGVTIELLNAGGTVIATTTTAADGSYSFTGLQPGTYGVRQPTQPPGTSSGQTVPGTINGTTVGSATTPATVPSLISGIVLPPNTQSVQNNFAELPNTRTVSGSVFLDYDNNGLLDSASGDHGLGGQVINLTGTDVNGTTVTRTTTTAADGSYSFTELPPGVYTVTQPTQPSGTTNGITTAGSAGGTPTLPATTPSAISGIDLTTVTISGGNNFAERPEAAPDLAISKTHAPSAFAAGGNVGYYTITPRNIGPVATSGTITIVDTLPAGITVAEPATGTGWACVGPVGSSVVTCTGTTPIAANATGAPITLRVSVDTSAVGQVLVNRVVISGGGEPPGFDGNNSAEDPVAVTAGASLSGHVWRDTNHDRIRDAGEPLVEGWTVELLNGGVVVATTTTDATGAYRFEELAPGSGYTVRFREPGTGRLYGRPVPNERGVSYTNGVVNASANPAGANNANGVLEGLTLLAGDNVVEQSLPLDPAGVVYDAITRAPVSGATVTISGPAGFTAAHVIGGQLSQVTGTSGAYQFLLLPGAPAGTYTLTVTEPPGYAAGVSTLIPACTATLNVLPAPPDPALVQTSNDAPDGAVPLHDAATCASTSAGLGAGAGTTQYYLSFDLNPAFPGGSANLVNNHIPLDPMGATGFSITKTGDKRVVEVGDTVLYTITVRRTQGAAIPQITVHDRLPAGFTLVLGTVRVNGVAAPNPSGGVGPVLGFTIGGLSVGGTATLTYRVRVGVGSQQGTGLNIARAYGCAVLTGCLDASQNPVPASISSNEARFQVKVTGGVFTTEACVVGKIFVDCNGNHIQDAEEVGIPGVRLYFQNGNWLISDSEGKYSQCGITPNSHVLKVDQRTLPKGARLTTSSNRNLGDGNSLFLDIKNGELHRADFVEGSCANPVMEQVKARRAQGEVRTVQTERKGGPALRFESKPLAAPVQATDSANQPIVQPRAGEARAR